MSTDTPYRYRGAFIPVFRPMDAITTDPTSSADWGLCLADDWQPAVLAALKVLCRPESWTGDPADIESAMLGAQKILASVLEPCSGEGIPFACPYDVVNDFSGWTIINNPSLTPPNQGDFVSGVGLKATTASQSGSGYAVRSVDATLDLGGSVMCTSIDAYYSFVLGNITGPGFANGIYAFSGGSVVGSQTYDPYGHADEINQHLVISFAVPTAVDHLEWYGFSSYSNIAVALGTIELYSIQVNGVGTPPDHCV